MNVLFQRRRVQRNAENMSLIVACVAITGVALFVFSIDRVSNGLVRGYARQGGAALYALSAAASNAVTESGFLSTRAALAQENAELKDALRMREEHEVRFRALEEENELLRELASLSIDTEGVAAPVLSSFSSSPYGTFRIGSGSEKGIEEGSLVLTPGGFVLGVVTYVTYRTATVEAFFAPGKNLEMQVRGTAFTAEGRGGGNARGEIARAANAGVGDVVSMPAFESRPVGVVGEVRSASSSPYATLFVRTPVNLDSLRYVYVLPIQ